jgi:membrane protein DedA with SNARE-associated domain
LHYVGRRYGRSFFLRRNFRYLSAADIMKVESHLRKWGALILICSRFVVGLRAAIALTAGIGRYNTAKMLVYSTISYLIFVGLLMYMSMALVENFDRIAYYFRTYNSIVWPLLILLVVTYLVRRFFRLHRRA